MTSSPSTATPADERDARTVLDAWLGDHAYDLGPLPGTGFSGAAVWRVQASTGRFVLKRFPAGTPPERPAWVHRLMEHVRGVGCGEIPVVARTAGGETLVPDRNGRLWELVALVPGGPTRTPTPVQAAAAMEALARVHRAAASMPGPTPDAAVGLPRRIEHAGRLLRDSWRARSDRLAPLAAGDDLPRGMRLRFDRAIENFAAADGDRLLAAFAGWRSPDLPVQPVLRDVWADHAFFDHDRVTGFIDLHAAAFDTPATDIARLLGSWTSPWPATGAWAAEWEPALRAYEAVRPLSAAERRALPLLHASTIVLGLDNWFRWVLDEERCFPAAAALDRVDRLLHGLPDALRAFVGGGPISDFPPV